MINGHFKAILRKKYTYLLSAHHANSFIYNILYIRLDCSTYSISESNVKQHVSRYEYNILTKLNKRMLLRCAAISPTKPAI